ncbi:tyrosine-type recombinase/integrase [Streptomyces javensis]|uniref:Tyrosine-type recombinase/integrase n=1 Tax=Streptomyces javensis TaxID=114698 RepID=A0ABS0RE05_9ACTN|nr:tyrosine-type recombinase/integrase [Streptomyces javensis]MBI0315144.1 tyrosine-type recombinase/integrase [Streptomyces javensis]
MTAAMPLTAAPSAEASHAMTHVLHGAVLSGAAATLAGLLDPAFLAEAGWDPAVRLLSLPARHPLLGRTLCRVDGCEATAHGTKSGGLCHRCLTRLAKAGMSLKDIAAATQLPSAPPVSSQCAVAGCLRMSPAGGRSRTRIGLCQAHLRRLRRTPGLSVERFLADPRVKPLSALGPCIVAACVRRAESEHGLCPTHYVRWRAIIGRAPGTDQWNWCLTASAVAESGHVSLRGLPDLVVVETLFGLQQRVCNGAKVNEVSLRAVTDSLRHQQAVSITQCDVDRVRAGRPARALARSLIRDIRRALADPGSEQPKDHWDLGVFGHPGRLSFTGIRQSWLRAAAKLWAAEELPRHRGAGANNVREKVKALARLSEVLHLRPDQGEHLAALGRSDIENFLNRLAFLESTGQISRYRRNVICRGARAALAGIHARGLTRAGQVAAGLPGTFTIGIGDIPAEPERGEPGRDLPAEIMTVLCANLNSLEPAEVKAAIQIAIDTGRRPEDIVALPLDCLRHDKDGSPVLVYDNAKADRLGRRLPISTTTATVITGQQQRVRDQFGDTPIAELKLLPAPRRNPDGRRPMTISMPEGRHRLWVDGLGELRTRDGVTFDSARAVPYAYRHSYAQRHADAGVPIDVLADLLDHRNLNVTRGYYRIGEDRRRDAVDKVTALSFDRHGNRIWHQAAALLESEHARYTLGEVAVPYGRCTEPSNVQAGGGACPIRFRCVGCDHFRTDVSFLPDLTVYLDDLLRTRERLAAAVDGVDEWARLDATPTEQEIARIRRLISRIKTGLSGLDDAEQTRIDEAVAMVRKHRAVSLGMPTLRVGPTAPLKENA